MTYPGDEQGGWQQQPGYPQQQPGYPQQGGYPQQPAGPYPPAGPQPTMPYQGQPPPFGQRFEQLGEQSQQPYGQPIGSAFGQPTGQPYGQQPPVGPPTYWQPQQKPKRRTGLIAGIIVAVVVLAGGGVGTWIALNRTAEAGSTGSATPQAAATKLLADLGRSDVVGLVNDLPPGEAGFLRDSISDSTSQLKRLQIMKPDANPEQSAGTVHTTGIRFDPAVQQVNDHLAITKLDAGTITVDSDLSKVGYTDKFLKALGPSSQLSTKDTTLTVRPGKPFRIATVKVNGQWYPSLFYSITDYALQSAHESWPSHSIPATGSASPDAAVRGFVQALLDSDFGKAIGMTAPDEMAALHDAGPAILAAAGSSAPSGVRIDSVSFTDRDVTGGVDAVLSSMTLDSDGEKITVTQGGGCYTITDAASGQNQRMCASDLGAQMQQGAGGLLPPALGKFMQDLASGLVNGGLGIVTTQVDGQWYVSPARTFTQLTLTVLNSVSADDLSALLQFGSH
ncbi:MAG TPA: flagellar basal body protein FliL [Pseudonocardiaceae bacterium]|jgi:hypothetical protein|nr:flagellar basal body protein FliL [Pseudonocardiaceae bacterium]